MSRGLKQMVRCPSCEGGTKPPAYILTRRADGVRLCAHCRGEGYLTKSREDLMRINEELANLNWQTT